MGTGLLSARARLRACQLGFAICLASVTGCARCDRSEPRLGAAREPVEGTRGAADAELQPEVRAAADAAKLGPSPKGAEAALTPEQVLELLLVPEVGRWTPEEASVHLAPLGLSREEPLPGSLQLARATPTLRINLHYLPDGSGKFAFADALMELPTTTATQASRAYRDIAALLATKLGKATWVKEDPEYPTSGYALGAIKVTLGAVASTKDGLPYVALSLAAPSAD